MNENVKITNDIHQNRLTMQDNLQKAFQGSTNLTRLPALFLTKSQKHPGRLNLIRLGLRYQELGISGVKNNCSNMIARLSQTARWSKNIVLRITCFPSNGHCAYSSRRVQ